MMWPRKFLGLAVGMAILPVAHGAEMEIYVTTGADGVEIFSNLPRGPEGRRGKMGNEQKLIAPSAKPANPSLNETETISVLEVSRIAEIDASGKSFLLGD
ncbi:MAG: hypothetical protein KA440_02570 [Azonexus sp.]|jgi:hypothetical protein|nr:hypothetical protein [Azonexus sp.]